MGENPMKELQTAQNTNHKMASRRTLKDFFNRRRDHSEEIAREGGQESFQGEFSSMDSFMQRDSIAAMQGQERRTSGGSLQQQLSGQSGQSGQTGSRKGSKHFDMTE